MNVIGQSSNQAAPRSRGIILHLYTITHIALVKWIRCALLAQES